VFVGDGLGHEVAEGVCQFLWIQGADDLWAAEDDSQVLLTHVFEFGEGEVALAVRG
jgi:hypothetical protein